MAYKRKHERYTAKAVVQAVTGSAGIKTTIARRLKVHRHTVTHYLEVYPEALEAYENEINEVGDMVEVTILEAIKAKDVETAKWYAKNKLKDRGYSERIEHSGADGAPIKFIVEVPPRAETAEQWLQQYQAELTHNGT
jgi:hypothetical protein